MKDWNSRYAKAGTDAEARMFGTQPCEYLREVLARTDVAPRSALCLGDGDGRNGTWLAAQGIAVTAVDLSDVATDHARHHDAAAGVTVGTARGSGSFRCARVNEPPYSLRASCDVVARRAGAR